MYKPEMFVPRSVTKHLYRGNQKADKPTGTSNPAADRNPSPSEETTTRTSPTLSQHTQEAASQANSSETSSIPYNQPAVDRLPGAGVEHSREEAVHCDEEEEPIVSYSKNQRMPEPGEPVCVVCGRYGAYIVDQTDQDICSLECKARHLHQLGLPLTVYRKVEEVGKEETDDVGEGKKETKKLTGDVSTSGEKSVNEVRKGLISSMDEWTYREHVHVIALTESQVHAIRSKYSITVRGGDAPKPVTEFSHLGLPETVMENLTGTGYVTPTPVQMQAIPAALLGRDLLVCATTGSGKTLSFLLPLLLNILHSTTPKQRAASPRGLVLAPTRELAMQIEQQAKDIMKGIPTMRTALIVGGVPLPQQLHRLRTGVQVVIATPARLNDIITHHTSEIELMDIEVFVVDEVDCLLQMGFENQFREIEELIPRRRQNLMFSATLPPKIERMASKTMENPLSITIGEPGVPCEFIKHTVIWVEENSKRKKLMALLSNPKHFQPPAVVFVSSKMGTLLLAEAINKMHLHLSAVGIHGDMAQERRSEIVRGCLEGKYSVVVATNVLGRGLDLVTVRQVILFDMPSSISEFIHQVGRAGRLSSPGTAYTFINNSNKAVFADLVNLLKSQGVQLPVQLINSPYLQAQLEKRKRASEDERALRGAKKQRSEHSRDKSYYDRSSLLEMIKANSK